MNPSQSLEACKFGKRRMTLKHSNKIVKEKVKKIWGGEMEEKFRETETVKKYLYTLDGV